MDPFTGDTLKYGGRDFPLQAPAFRHVRVILPAAGRIMPKFGAMQSDFSVVDEALVDDAMAIVFAGVQAGTPGMTREEFEALPCDMNELFAAVTQVLHAAGLRPKEGAQGEVAAGSR